MKKALITRILTFTLILVMLIPLFTSCGSSKLSGKYTNESFMGSKVTIKFTLGGLKLTEENSSGTNTYKGEYKINGDKISITFKDQNAGPYSGVYTYEITEESLVLNGMKFVKQ